MAVHNCHRGLLHHGCDSWQKRSHLQDNHLRCIQPLCSWSAELPRSHRVRPPPDIGNTRGHIGVIWFAGLRGFFCEANFIGRLRMGYLRKEKGQPIRCRSIVWPQVLLLCLQISRSFTAIAASLDFKVNFLVFVQTVQASALYCCYVNKHVFAAIVRCNKAITFVCVKPFYGASSRPVYSISHTDHVLWQVDVSQFKSRSVAV